jgi:hypothetical protein
LINLKITIQYPQKKYEEKGAIVMMNRKVKKMYAETLKKEFLKNSWTRDYEYSSRYSTKKIYYLKSNVVKIDSFHYHFSCFLKGFFFKKAGVTVAHYRNDYRYDTDTDIISFSLFSPTYWRIVQLNWKNRIKIWMDKQDRKNKNQIQREEALASLFKKIKDNEDQKDLEATQKNIENLSHMLEEQKELMAQMQNKKEKKLVEV